MVADIEHCNVERGAKLSLQALQQLGPVIQESRRNQYDAFVDLGDRINDVDDTATDSERAYEVSALLKQAGCRREHLMGNHDIYTLTTELWEDALGASARSRVWDMKGRRLIFFCPDVDNKTALDGTPLPGPRNHHLRQDDINWLESALATDLPAILFSHVPLHPASQIGNFYFDGTVGRAAFENADIARAMMSDSTVFLSVSGHSHWNSWNNENGIHYITIPSLVDNFVTHPYPTGAWATLSIRDDIELNVTGLDPLKLTLPIRKPRRLWLSP